MKKQTFNPENPNGIIEDMTAEEEAKVLADIESNANDVSMNKKIEAELELKASAKAKLVAGEPLTEAEADTLVL
jgi:hypothetical protein